MSYSLEFGELAQYAGMFARGAALTLALTAGSTVLGVGIGIAGAAARESRSRVLRGVCATYVEAIRNTPFIIQLFFVFFGLPALGVRLDELSASVIAMTLNLGAYATEIVRAGVAAVPRGHLEAAASLAMTPAQTYRHVVLPQALAKVFPALTSQIVIVMLGSAVVSQISVPDLTYAASYIQSRNFRAFETYLTITASYLGLAVIVRMALNAAGRKLFARGAR
ncbi:amino acid ABC transporter permease [Trinickia caryophylli]|uniref:Amino acid ABC transporter membrane protein 1, PAAT family n=1 Tax=Trinickia caryophylli TaxID=28094 RepID=A0A1X7CIA6_TRICW|nr:amino acid ABC transporter permease [Trinickia caryophylli]PMS11532.1 amino acid ABC transporter permease [Trinickia caryophylli]TRX19914.1 amino acid ABC transporter permease [Trinickia caryophylli]WQE12751.1 amino acid ABC transporter permease [Trinickia caryophylli]SME97158.1 amino acid ABC transporter membrane protein 1, PAAT family [Trinickia caryophylli]GLU30459.1 polar amino acid ABC transporter permease [Trinickia caryophylli]